MAGQSRTVGKGPVTQSNNCFVFKSRGLKIKTTTGSKLKKGKTINFLTRGILSFFHSNLRNSVLTHSSNFSSFKLLKNSIFFFKSSQHGFFEKYYISHFDRHCRYCIWLLRHVWYRLLPSRRRKKHHSCAQSDKSICDNNRKKNNDTGTKQQRYNKNATKNNNDNNKNTDNNNQSKQHFNRILSRSPKRTKHNPKKSCFFVIPKSDFSKWSTQYTNFFNSWINDF